MHDFASRVHVLAAAQRRLLWPLRVAAAHLFVRGGRHCQFPGPNFDETLCPVTSPRPHAIAAGWPRSTASHPRACYGRSAAVRRPCGTRRPSRVAPVSTGLISALRRAKSTATCTSSGRCAGWRSRSRSRRTRGRASRARLPIRRALAARRSGRCLGRGLHLARWPRDDPRALQRAQLRTGAALGRVAARSPRGRQLGAAGCVWLAGLQKGHTEPSLATMFACPINVPRALGARSRSARTPLRTGLASPLSHRRARLSL